VIPTYNSEEKIDWNLKELVKTIPKSTEIIVVDDGSSDNTTQTVHNFIYYHPENKMKLIEKEHTNPANTRNEGWKEAEGDMIIFLDSDCTATKNWYTEMLKPFEEKDVIAVSGVYLSKQKEYISRYVHEQTEMRQNKVEKYTDNLATYSLAIKKEMLKKVGGFPEIYPTSSCEDTEFSYKLRKYGKFILNKKAKVYHHHKNNIRGYLKKQFQHAKYRVLLYKRKNPVGDKYAGFSVMAQPFMALFSILLFPFLPYSSFIFIWLLLVIQIRETRSNEFKFYLFSVTIGMIRAYVWLFGMGIGVIEFYVLKKEGLQNRTEDKDSFGEELLEGY
jgi:glycosyltransferase involved in cell wall biosynthesis